MILPMEGGKTPMEWVQYRMGGEELETAVSVVNTSGSFLINGSIDIGQ